MPIYKINYGISGYGSFTIDTDKELSEFSPENEDALLDEFYEKAFEYGMSDMDIDDLTFEEVAAND